MAVTMQSGSSRGVGFRVEHQCRQCGAPVTLAETDRLIRCPYCRVRAYLVADGVFRYLLPHRMPHRELLYFPYWRFRGVFYACTGSGVEHRIIDTSQRGIDVREFPSSLGLRAQAMPLRFATPETEGAFLPPRLTAPAAAQALAQRCLSELARPVLHHDFIGEALSLIYAPFHVDGRLLDAVTGRAVPGAIPADLLSRLPASDQAPAGARLVPALCPHCGWDLEGEPDALVLLCRNCQAALRATPEGLVSTAFGRLPAGPDTATHLPFWRIAAGIGGLPPAGQSGRSRAGNVLGALGDAWEARQLTLWVPAFKIRPDIFLLMARAFTLARPREGSELRPAGGAGAPKLPKGPCHPVNLSLSEALESLKVVLASLCSPPETYLPDLPSVSVEPRDTRLVFIPFADAGSQWAHGDSLAVSKNALGYGLCL